MLEDFERDTGEIDHEVSDSQASGSGCGDDKNVNGFLIESGHLVAGEICNSEWISELRCYKRFERHLPRARP